MHEVKLIERARMKRAWEAKYEDIKDESDLQKRRDVIAAMERDEWAFREQVRIIFFRRLSFNYFRDV